MDFTDGPTGADELATVLQLVMIGGGGWYLLRILLALTLVGLARWIPAARSHAMRCAPIAVRPLLARAVVGGLITAGLAGPAAWADQGPCPDTADAVPVLDRGEICAPKDGQPAAPDMDPARTGGSAAPPGTSAATSQAAVIVQQGDTLWSITAGMLGPGAGAAAVADGWPDLWQANADVIGPDPGLIHPGTELTVPAALSGKAVR